MMLHAKAPLLALASLVALGGCATARATKVAVCDGRHRRPVNVHGSVLGAVPPSVAAAAQTAPSAAQRPAQTTVPSRPAKVSAVAGPLRFPSC